MNTWEIIGWAGSVLVIVSLMVPSVRRFRVLNLAGSFIATVYNIYFGIWPYAAMNGVIVAIDAYWLWRLSREGDEERGYSVVEARGDDAVVVRFLDRHASAIAKSFPSFRRESLPEARALLIMHEEEIIGLFGMRVDGGIGHIVLDFVTERFRDFTPGAFLYNNKEIFAGMGVKKLELTMGQTTDPVYFAKQGFVDEGELLYRAI